MPRLRCGRIWLNFMRLGSGHHVCLAQSVEQLVDQTHLPNLWWKLYTYLFCHGGPDLRRRF